MPTPTQAAPPAEGSSRPAFDDLSVLAEGFATHLQGHNKSPATIASYLNCAHALARFLRSKKLPTSASQLTPKHIDAFMADLQQRVASATAAKHFRSLQQFFKFLARDDDGLANPMLTMSPPKIDEKQVPVITVEHVQQMLDAARGNTFENRRDTALMKFLYDTGVRVGELVGMTLADHDHATKTVTVTGKGNKTRMVKCGANASEALRRYLAYRVRHPLADKTDAFWIGRKGKLTVSGVAAVLNRRAQQAGAPHVHPHQFRHTFAHNWLDGGGSEGDLMYNAGWSSRQMLGRYGNSVAGVRARGAHERFSPADRLLK